MMTTGTGRTASSPGFKLNRWLRRAKLPPTVPSVPDPTLAQSVTLELLDATGTPKLVVAELRYELSDPYAVTIAFMVDESPVSWTFGRDLLTMGLDLYTPSGDGDVHVWPCFDPSGRAVVIIELTSPDGAALLRATARDLS